MGRTVQEIRVQRGVDDVRNFIAGWFNNNQFKVLEWQSQGAEITHWHLTARWKIHPRPGSIVAIQASSITNAVLFELMLMPEGPGTLLHGEFYVPAIGFVGGKEMDVSENPGLNAMIPRKRGHALMVSFFQALGQMPGSPSMAYGMPQQPMAYPPSVPSGQQAAFSSPQPQQAPQPSQFQAPATQPPSQPQTTWPVPPSQAPQPGPQAPPPIQYQAPAIMPPPQPQTTWPVPPSQAPQPVPQAIQTAAQPSSQVGTQQQTFYCVYCGTPLPPIAKFCVHCGHQAIRPSP